MDFAKSLLTAHWQDILHWTITLVLAASGLNFKLAYEKERRVLKNLNRPILMVGTKENDLLDQSKLLERIGLFKVEKHNSVKSVDFMETHHRLVVLGYENSDAFREVFNCCKTRKIPVLIYAKPNEIDRSDLSLIHGYTFASMCNTDLRLVNDTFAAMSTLPEN